MSNTIRDILDDITFHPSDIDMDNERRDYAEQAINAYILGEVEKLLGDDDMLTPAMDAKGHYEDTIYARNQLRQELRNKANKKWGK
jgi:hypothetical protein